MFYAQATEYYSRFTFIPEGEQRGRGRSSLCFYDIIKLDLKAKDICIDVKKQYDF